VTRSSSIAEKLLWPFDRMRLAFLRTLGPLAKPIVRRRELRVAIGGSLTVCVAFALALGIPWWLLALGPIFWGVPHVLADVRYLVVRPGLHRRKRLWFAAGIPLAFAGCGIWSVPSGLAAAGAVAVLSNGPVSRKAIALTIILVLIAAAIAVGDLAMLIFAHAHNFIAVILWWFWRPRVKLIHALVPALFALASLTIVFGWLQPATAGLSLAPPGLNADYHLSLLSPGLAEPWALRFVILFAFAQAVHYGVWLRLIPEDDRPQPTPRTFRASFRALRADMGTWFLAGAFLVALGVAIWATLDLLEARSTYLRLALFHGHIELAAGAFLFVEGWRRSPKQ
jgi:hypothetical protein